VKQPSDADGEGLHIHEQASGPFPFLACSRIEALLMSKTVGILGWVIVDSSQFHDRRVVGRYQD
jgi:hypothetical protein